MKKSIIRVSAATMAVLMASGALTACSGGSSSQTTAAATEAEKSSEAAGSEAVSEGSGSGDAVTIRLVHPYNFIHGVFHELDSYFTSMAAATGNEDVWMKSQKGEAELSDNATVKEAMEMFSKLASYKDAGDTAVDQTQGIQNFAAEQRPMYINGGWLMGDTLAANPDGEFGMFPMPWSNNPDDNKMWVGIDDCFVISSQTQHKDEVMKLMKFIANDASSKTWMSTAKLMTSNVNVSVDDENDLIKAIKSYMDEGKIVSKSLVPDYTSEFSTAFRTKLQWRILSQTE